MNWIELIPFLGAAPKQLYTIPNQSIHVRQTYCTNTGLLLHYKSHVDDQYKHGLPMLCLIMPSATLPTGPTFPRNVISSKWFHLDRLINSTILHLIGVKASDQLNSKISAVNNEINPVHIVLPFKDQALDDIVWVQLKDLSQEIQVTIQPMFAGHNTKKHLKPCKVKLSVVNQQSLLYQFKYDLRDAGQTQQEQHHLYSPCTVHKYTDTDREKITFLFVLSKAWSWINPICKIF